MTLVEVLAAVLDWTARIVVWSVMVPATVFAVRYAGKRSNWRATPAGRSVMYLVLTIDAVLLFGFLRTVLPDWISDSVPLLLLRLGVYVALAVSVWRMPFVLVRQQRLGPITPHQPLAEDPRRPRSQDADTDPRMPAVQQ